MNILHITPDFNYACGRSYYVYLLLKYFNHGHNKVFLATNGGDSFDRLNALGIPIFIVKSLKSKNPVSLTKSIRHIRELIIDNKADIIHTHHRYAELISVQARNLVRTGRPAAVHTALSFVGRKYMVEFRSDKIIAVSNSVYRMLIGRFGVSKQKIEMIPNFVDTDELKAVKETTGNRHRKYYNILAVGRFHHEKNFETLLKAIHKLKSDNIRLILVGEGDKYVDYKKYIHKHKLHVEIVVPQKELQKYFQLADICVLPSVRDPFPNFMLQSGLHKKPFIGARVDGIAELIKDGHNGLLFSSGDENELAEKIRHFKKNSMLADYCAHNLFSNVVHNYTQKKIIPKISGLYEKLVRSRTN